MINKMEQRRTLLERFGIPINHLDFEYIKKCENAREMEKIVQILRSGEEGHYPDLTKCAENRLQELKPQSRLFRFEEPLRSHDCLGANEWKPIYDWTHEIKTKDTKLSELNKCVEGRPADDAATALDLPPIRKSSKITQFTKENTNTTINTTTTIATTAAPIQENVKRTKSIDYSKWDKYDADEELLRMDLADERVNEDVERKNRLNLQKCNKIMENKTKQETKLPDEKLVHKLADIERDKLAEEYRIRGNDYFRTKEYDSAIAEYSRAINIHPEAAAAAYNNRAIANIKLQKYAEAIDDCEKCLQQEPQNVKGRLRLAEATFYYGRRRESYELYQKVLELEPTNAAALKATAELRSQLGELPPAHATRLQIQECSTKIEKQTKTKTNNQTIATTKKKEVPAAQQCNKDYDLADLVRPNNIVKSKLAEALSGGLKQKPKQISTNNTKAKSSDHESEAKLQLPMNSPKSYNGGRVLIEEI